MPNKWKIAGYLFSTATVVLLISLTMNIYAYYFKEMESGKFTLSEVCDDKWEDDFSSTAVCYPVKQEKYNLFAGSLFGAGLALLCFAKSDEIKGETGTVISQNKSQVEAVEKEAGFVPELPPMVPPQD
jgi:hypothetical protein